MDKLKEKFIKKAIVDFGLEVEPNICWFIDEHKIYYGVVNNGEVEKYLYGVLANNTFLIEYTSSENELDIQEWKTFIERYLEVPCLTELI